MWRPAAALLLALAAGSLVPRAAAITPHAIVQVDADGTVVRRSSDQRVAARRNASAPPPSATVVPLTVAVEGEDDRPNKTVVATAIAGAAGVPAGAVSLEPTKRSDAGMACPKRSCAAWTANVIFGNDVGRARAFRVAVDAAGPVAVAVAKAAASSTSDTRTATVQYAYGLFPDDLPDDFDYYDELPGGGRRLGAGAIVAIVAAAAILVVSAAGMAGTVLRGCLRRRKQEAVADEEAGAKVEGAGKKESIRRGDGANGGAAAVALPTAAAAVTNGGLRADTAVVDRFERTATV